VKYAIFKRPHPEVQPAPSPFEVLRRSGGGWDIERTVSKKLDLLITKSQAEASTDIGSRQYFRKYNIKYEDICNAWHLTHIQKITDSMEADKLHSISQRLRVRFLDKFADI
jgi:hypothetical protein